METERSEFSVRMMQILELLDLLVQRVQKMPYRPNLFINDELLDNQDVLQMLKISARSLQRYRSTGLLPYYSIRGKLYYKLNEIRALLRKGSGRLKNANGRTG